MLRHDRSRFIAYGLSFFLNDIAIALYALDATTSGRGNDGFMPAVILSGVYLLACIPSCIRRGRDINLPAIITCLLLFILGPLIIVFIGVLIFKKSSENARVEFGPIPEKAGINVWLTCLNIWAMPWIIIKVSTLFGY